MHRNNKVKYCVFVFLGKKKEKNMHVRFDMSNAKGKRNNTQNERKNNIGLSMNKK